MLYTEVCRVAHALSSLRIRKGDHVVLYMPMIPELFIAMLACAALVPSTRPFSGYAEGGVRSRIQGCKARVVYHRRRGSARWQVQAAQGQS